VARYSIVLLKVPSNTNQPTRLWGSLFSRHTVQLQESRPELLYN